MEFFTNKRRALSTIITTAIMLSAVAMMGSFLVLWSNSAFSSHKIVMESTYSSKLNKLNEFLVIENVWFGQSPTKFVNITMNNAGTVWLNVNKIQLVSSEGSQAFSFTNFTVAPNTSNSTKIIYDWTDNIPISVVVTSARDSIYRAQAMP